MRWVHELLTDGGVQIRVVPKDRVFIHGKAGVIEKADGTTTCFLGSINETKSAFAKNYEILWEDESPEGVAWVEEEFAALWEDAYRLRGGAIRASLASGSASKPERSLSSWQHVQGRPRLERQCQQQYAMQNEERPRNPSLDVGNGTICPASSLLGKPPLAGIRCRWQVAFELVDELELHAVHVAVRLDDLVPEKTDDDAEQRNRQRPPALAETCGGDSVERHEAGIEGEQQPT